MLPKSTILRCVAVPRPCAHAGAWRRAASVILATLLSDPFVYAALPVGRWTGTAGPNPAISFVINGSGRVTNFGVRVTPNFTTTVPGPLTVTNNTFAASSVTAGKDFSLTVDDDPVIAGSSMTRAGHITALRTRIDALRVRFGLLGFNWTDPVLTGIPVKAVHVQELRTALAPVCAAAQEVCAFTDEPIVPRTTIIRAAHIIELRSFVTDLEGGGIPNASDPLVQRDNLIYQGAFRVPGAIYSNGHSTFGYGGTGLAFNPANNSLFMVGHDWYQEVAEIGVPQVRSSTNVNALTTATLLQPFADVTEGRLPSVNPGDPNAIKVGGLLPYRDKLYATAYAYYDGAGTQVLSHFVSGLDLSAKGDITGPYRVGAPKAGYVSGYMGLVPQAWQAALGGPVLNGQCCLNIVGRTSYGPALFTIDPADIGVKNPAPATALVYYPGDHPLGEYRGTSQYYNGATMVKGVVFPEGTRSVLLFGRHGEVFCYGPGTADASKAGTPATDIGDTADVWCYDPTDSSKGGHAYPYQFYVWAYDALELANVKGGTKQPWDVKPYAVWALDLPPSPWGRVYLEGAAYDPATGRIFLTQAFGEGELPVIHVFTIGALH